MKNKENGMEILFYGGQFTVNFIDHLLCTGYCYNIHRKSTSRYLHLTSHCLIPLMTKSGETQTQSYGI